MSTRGSRFDFYVFNDIIKIISLFHILFDCLLKKLFGFYGKQSNANIMENKKDIDEIKSFCSKKYTYWATGSIQYSLFNQEILFSKYQQKVAFVMKKTSSNLISDTVGGIFYPFVHKVHEIKYILCILDLDTQNVLLEMELSSGPSGDLDIDKILSFSDTLEKKLFNLVHN